MHANNATHGEQHDTPALQRPFHSTGMPTMPPRRESATALPARTELHDNNAQHFQTISSNTVATARVATAPVARAAATIGRYGGGRSGAAALATELRVFARGAPRADVPALAAAQPHHAFALGVLALALGLLALALARARLRRRAP